MRAVRYQIAVVLLSELVERLESKRLKKILKEVLAMGESQLIDVPSEEVEGLCKKATVRKKFYVDKETYLQWKSVPMVFKRWVCYWINKKLLEEVEVKYESAKG
jgi:hypothetical protein